MTGGSPHRRAGRCPIRAQLELDAVAISPRLARRFVAETLGAGALGVGDFGAAADVALVDAAELLVSELVTNAVVHARSAATVVITISDDHGVRIEVHDDAPDPPQLGSFDLDAVSGRGLALVDALSWRWGVEPSGPGKQVWFELPLTAVLAT